MKRLLFIAVVLTGCATSIPVNQSLVSDGQLLVTGLTALEPLLPPADQIIATTALGTINAELTDLKTSAASSVTVASLMKSAITDLVNDLPDENATVTAGVDALAGVAGVLLSDVTAPVPATAAMASGTDPRARLAGWTAMVKTAAR